MRGVVATGHPLTTEAAIEMLSLDGNAFDAAIAAAIASVVTEPTLTSFGGGGFFLSHSVREKKDILFDFFVNTPGIGLGESINPEMTATPIRFPGCTQIFHTGPASVAVPGMLKGLLHVHERLCTLPLKTVIGPAMKYLEEGVIVNERQDIFMGLLKPIMLASDYGKEIFMKDGRYIKLGDRLFNPELKGFFHRLAKGENDIYSGAAASRLANEMTRNNGMITEEDLDAYRVIEREPLRIKYRDRDILTNPPPSTGGILLALALTLLGNTGLSEFPRDSEEVYVSIIEAMKEMTIFTPEKNGKLMLYPSIGTKKSPLIAAFLKNIREKVPLSSRGTTHISVIDKEGNAASVTTSNGSASGYYIPGTGIMLNNMMGEDDLHPGGFHSSPPNKRVSSMMLPTIVMKKGKVDCALGSGGSKRIRTAVLQVLINIIDFGIQIKESVEMQRMHYEEGKVHLEPGVSGELISSLKKHYEVNTWSVKDMYFGGVHCVGSNMDGWGDTRRGGYFATAE